MSNQHSSSTANSSTGGGSFQSAGAASDFCKKGCGFYGSADQNYLCSKCYREELAFAAASAAAGGKPHDDGGGGGSQHIPEKSSAKDSPCEPQPLQAPPAHSVAPSTATQQPSAHHGGHGLTTEQNLRKATEEGSIAAGSVGGGGDVHIKSNCTFSCFSNGSSSICIPRQDDRQMRRLRLPLTADSTGVNKSEPSVESSAAHTSDSLGARAGSTRSLSIDNGTTSSNSSERSRSCGIEGRGVCRLPDTVDAPPPSATSAVAAGASFSFTGSTAELPGVRDRDTQHQLELPSQLTASAPPRAPENPAKPEQTARNRCWSCNKRVGLLGFSCRCGYIFCSIHRHSDAHDCSFDYRGLARVQLEKANRRIVAEKLERF